jgi:mannan endo-1,4-beta-mannosidase
MGARLISRSRSARRVLAVFASVTAILGMASGVALATPATSGPSGVITASGEQLLLNRAPYRFVGSTAYELATDWGINAGCGGMLSDTQLNSFFASLPPNSLVRFWAYQALATNVHTHALDWAGIDRVFAAAAAHGQRLIVSLAGEGGTCDGQSWQDLSWYEGGYRQVDDTAANSNGAGLDPLSYWNYVSDIVNRYHSSPALGMWEPISEAEASTCSAEYEPTNCGGHQTCPDEHVAAVALRSFFDAVGAEIHRLDPTHLVEDGLLASGQCGSSSTDYEYVSESPGIDVLSYQDYYGPEAGLLPGDQWNGVAERLTQAAQVGKPIIASEIGIAASPQGHNCPSNPSRLDLISARLGAAMARGSSGGLVWNWSPDPVGSGCSYDVSSSDPLVGGLTVTALSALG